MIIQMYEKPPHKRFLGCSVPYHPKTTSPSFLPSKKPYRMIIQMYEKPPQKRYRR